MSKKGAARQLEDTLSYRPQIKTPDATCLQSCYLSLTLLESYRPTQARADGLLENRKPTSQ